MTARITLPGSARLRGALVLAGWLACNAGPAGAALISVDFNSSASATYAGTEAAATAANAGFGAANVWNGLSIPGFGTPAVTDPTFSSLVDSTGSATAVSLSLDGTLNAFSRTANEIPDALRRDYLYFNAVSNQATDLSWSITGLTAGGNYDLFFYGPGRGGGTNPWNMRVVGTAADQSVTNFGGTAYFDDVKADASGRISGSLLPLVAFVQGNQGTVGYEVNWSGFQILADPVATDTSHPVSEPPVIAALCAALLGVGLARRSRRRDGRG